ncbi:hypothetical protein [Salinibacter ruber]|nr:hypothetical protein [Salinibacter ruber]
MFEATVQSIMDKNHDHYVVREMMPGAQVVQKIDKGTVEAEIARWDRLSKSDKRCVWFAIDWGDGKKYYELLSDRERAVVHSRVYEGDIPVALTYDREHSEGRGLDVYTPTDGPETLEFEEVAEDESGFEEASGGIINHDKVRKMLENGQRAEFENVPKSTVDECFRYVREGYARKASKRSNGNYDLYIYP